MKVITATKYNLDKILDIYSNARKYMAINGNPDQWGDKWPSIEALEEDISLSRLYLLVDDSNDILAVFALIIGEDPCYKDIEGSWLNNKEYITIHRLASSFKCKGVFHSVVQYILDKYSYDIRIDTHMNNLPMINAILKEGFKYTGVIYVNNSSEHSPRNAYQLER